jgi:2-dehydropantoate 2-reductase
MARDEILIVGTGAMANLFAARLSHIRRVSLLGTWEEGLSAIEHQGIRVLEMDGDESRARVSVVRDPGELSAIQFALVLVKSWQTERAARSLARCLAEDGVALTLQNGLGNLEILREILGEERAALGVTTTGATLLEPGVVRHGGNGPITLGPHEQNQPFEILLKQAGFDVQREDDLDGLIWSKLAVNAAINPLTALLEMRNGQLLAQEATRELMRSAAQEVARLADVLGIHLATNDPAGFALQVAERTSANVSSMLQDMQRGAPTEIDAICGAIVGIAGKHDMDTPINWALWKLVRAKADIGDGD